MTEEEFSLLIKNVQTIKTETQTLEIKAAHKGNPNIRETLSSFSNQDSGGIILFGIDEQNDFSLVGVYDAACLQKYIQEQCEQMTPPVRALVTAHEVQGKILVTAEIPPLKIFNRPCFYSGAGRVKGSYIRVGDADKHMTEYEVYSFEAYLKRYREDERPVEQSSRTILDKNALKAFIEIMKKKKPNLASLEDATVCELLGLTVQGTPTLAALLLFGLYPQASFPQLCVTATVIPGKEIGDNREDEARFLDNKRIEGTLTQMLDQALAFVQRNMRTDTFIDPATGKRRDKTEYPVTAVREILLNALIHRDYSRYTETTPICLNMFEDRLEVHNPGGLYGRTRVDELGTVRAGTRNPVLVVAMENLGLAENRFSGIPMIRKSMQEYGLPMPEFESGSSFHAILRNVRAAFQNVDSATRELLVFCRTPRSRQEIAAFLGIKSTGYAIRTYVAPLVAQGLLQMSLPDKPQSPSQKYMTVPEKRP